MAFDVENAMRYNAAETVDAEFSGILAEINYYNDILTPGETYSDEIEEQAGQVFVRKLGKSEVAITDATTAGGLDFVNTEAQDSLIPLINKDAVSVSEKCYGAVDAVRKSGKIPQKKEVATRSHQEKWQGLGVSYMFTDGNFTPSANTTLDTAATVADSILADQQQIIESNGIADVLIVSPAYRSLILSDYMKGKGFLPETNEEAKRHGKIGDFLGMKVYVSNFLGSASGVPAGAPGRANAVAAGYIMYDHRTFYIDTVFEGARDYVPEKFFGVLVQIQTVSGGINTNPERAIAKIIA